MRRTTLFIQILGEFMRLYALLLPLAFIACGEKTEDTSTDVDTTTETSLQPQEGGWTMTDLEITENTCGVGEEEMDEEDPSTMTLTRTAEGAYTLVLDEDTTFTCTLSDSELTCETVTETEESDELEEMDLTVTQTYNLGANFTSDTELSGDMSVDMSCEGEDCEMFELLGMTMPCGMVGTFNAAADAE